MKLIRATLAATLSAALAVQPALAGNTRLIRSGGAGSSAGLAGVELSVAAPSATAPLATALSGEGLAQPAVSPEMAAPRTEAFPVSEAVAPPATLGEVKASNVERREAAPDGSGSGSGSGFKGKQERPLVPGGKEVGETLEPTRSAATAEGAGAAMGGAFQRLILGGPGRGAVNGAEIPAAVGAPGAPARARLLAAPQAALGTPGVYSEDFHERYTNPRVRADMEAGRFVRLRVEGRRPVLLEAGPGVPEEEARAAAARLAELPELPLGFHGAEILLLKPEPGSDAARHPRHLVVSAGEQQVAHAGTHRDEAGAARGLYAYLPIGLALDAAVDANALRDLVAEELGHAHDRARALYAGRAPPRETFGTGQASLLARLHASLSLDFAAGRPADAEAAPAPRRAWPIRALAALGRWWSKRRASVDEVVPWSFPLVDNGYYYHGTTLEDLTAIVRSGGLMTPEVSQFSMRARDSIEYGSTRRRRQVASGQPTPLALLQFRYDDVSGYMSGKSFQAGVDAALAMGMFPIHAAYVAAEKPVPLSRMTEASKDSLLSYLALRRSLEPENTRWAALLPEFEKALGKRYEPARPAAAEAGAPAAERDPLLLGSPGAASSGSHRRALAARLAAQAGVRYTISGGRLAPAGAGASSPRAAAIAGLPAELEGAEVVLVPPAAPHPLLLAADAEHYTAAYARVRRDAAGRPLGIALYLPEALFSDPRLSDEDVRELVAGELERARARAQASPLRPVQEEAFGDDQVRALMRLRPILAAGGPASAGEPGRRDGPWSLARALLRFLGRITFIGPLLQTVLEPGFYAERDRFYSGTSMADLVDIVRGGGEMREGLTYVSDEPGFPFGYARSRGFARDAVGVVLQFDAAKLGGKLALGHYQPTAPVDRAGDRPDRLANFYVATQPIPLAALTEASKLSILRWIAGQMLAHPEDGSWEPLLRSFESALQYVYRPAAAGARLDATGVSRNRGVLLNVAGADALAPSLAFRGMSFAPKAELHVTMVDKAKTSAEQAAITDALRGARFSVTRTGRYRVARKDERVSIVELVDVAGLEAFYRRVEDSLGVARGTLTRPAPHVTLFTSPAGRGIGIDDEAAMAATEPVTDAAELAALGAAAP